MMGGMSQPEPAPYKNPPAADTGMDFMGFGNDPGFDMGGDNNQNNNDDNDAGWAAGFDDDAGSQGQDTNFAKSELKEVLSTSTPGSKQKKSGLGASGAVNWSNEDNQL